MALTPPNLDDRTFEQLLEEARQRAAKTCPEWTDWSPGNPGVTLLELFAYLTETMIYRLNRLPDKAYVEFLRLMGVRLHPPAAARVTLEFIRDESSAGDDAPQTPIAIPRGTRVSHRQGDAGSEVVFMTLREVVLEEDQPAVSVDALHCEQEIGEAVGVGTGMPGQSVAITRPPVVANTGEEDDLVIGVQVGLDEIGVARHRQCEDRVYRVWTEVEHFAESTETRFVYVVDRVSGTITFAPSIHTFDGSGATDRPQTLAEVPGKGREIRAWYRRGGGTAGNLAARTLTELLDPIDGLRVDNPAAATGGREAETLSNALVRGPQQLRSHDRAVTARDFERIAASFGSVARAHAATQAELWAHAEPGTVEITLVPEVLSSERPAGELTVDQMHAKQTRDATAQIQKTLDATRPLGSKVELHWADYRVVRVHASIRIFRGEDKNKIKTLIRQRLNEFISPLPTPSMPGGWPFDQNLTVGRLYDEVFRVPGVKEVDDLKLCVDDVPDQPVHAIVADAFQASTWHAISGNGLFRSLDNAESWQQIKLGVAREEGEQLHLVRTHAGRGGFVAATGNLAGEDNVACNIYYSADCGRSWKLALRTAFAVHDLAWIQRGQQPTLLLATAQGLYELAVKSGELTQVVLAGINQPDTGFWAIAVDTDSQGQPVSVAVAAKNDQGVWLSYEAGHSKTFLRIGLEHEDIRSLLFQTTATRGDLWAGPRVTGNRPGQGCFCWGGPVEKWKQVVAGWPDGAGSCLALASYQSQLFAATYGGGVVWLDCARADALRWRSPAADCGLPRGQESHRFQPIEALAIEPRQGDVMAGGKLGVHCSQDCGQYYESVCHSEYVNRVPLPRLTLFCAGEHVLEVETEGRPTDLRSGEGH